MSIVLRMNTKKIGDKLLIGRQEWCQLPQLDITKIKAKIDTGAKTSAIHAFNIVIRRMRGKRIAFFDLHPIQRNDTFIINCSALVIDERYIMSSNGHKERRYVIETELVLGSKSWPIELTLSKRDPLRYRLLLGREALNHHVIVDPSLSCQQGKFV